MTNKINMAKRSANQMLDMIAQFLSDTPTDNQSTISSSSTANSGIDTSSSSDTALVKRPCADYLDDPSTTNDTVNEIQTMQFPKKIVAASDKVNSKITFKSIDAIGLTQKMIVSANQIEFNVERPLDDCPLGSNYFFEVHNFFDKRWNDLHKDKRGSPEGWKMESCANALIKATVLAFAHHLPLRIKPDHIMYLIIQGFNVWVNKMGGDQKLVTQNMIKPGKTSIKIDISDGENDWDQHIDVLTSRITDTFENKQLASIMTVKFSTTTPLMMRVKTLGIASVMKKFVNINFDTCCGIPYVEIDGSIEDWEKLKVAANAILSLAGDDLSFWTLKLNSALDIFINTLKDVDTREEWRNFLNYNSSSGTHECHGWINSFFPYVKNGYDSDMYVKNKVLFNKSVSDNTNRTDFFWFPPSYVCETYSWTYNGQPRNKNLVITSGLMNVIQWTSEDCALEPMMAYMVTSSK